MAQLIDKDALVAEIERLKECNRKICAGDFDFLRKTYPEHYYSTETYNSILSFLDTLEVIEIGVDLGDPKGDKSAEYIIDTKTLEMKEVDLEKSARCYLLNEHKSPLNEVLHQCDLKTELQYHQDIENAYKAGFELGLKAAQKGE